MSEEKPSFLLYLCFEVDKEDGGWQSLALFSDYDEVGKWKNKPSNKNKADDVSSHASDDFRGNVWEDKDEDSSEDPAVALSQLMSRFRETMSSYGPLTGVGMIMMPTLRSHFIDNEIYKNAGRQLEVVDKSEQFAIYGVSVDHYPSVQTQIRRLRELDRGATVLPGAILLSLVATFDSFIADTLRIMLRHKPERLIESSKTIEVKEVLNMSSFDEVIGKITEDEVEGIMRGSHDDQIKYIEDKLDTKIRSYYEGWGEFMEIFERRNWIAHGNNVINMRYAKNCNRHKFKVGEDQVGKQLSLSEDYLSRSSDRLLEFGLSLMFVLWLKHYKDSKETAYKSFNHLAYELIKDGQSRVAVRLLDLALFRQSLSASDRVEKMMTINLANAYKKLGDDEKAKEIIAEVDWSAATDDFQICIAAIEQDIERFVELMTRVSQAKLLRKSDFREWPVFDRVREEQSVREKFEEIYGESIIDARDEDKKDREESSTATKGENSQTIH